MSLKVAVASSDGKVVNRHFGQAGSFLIFELSDGIFKFLEARESKPVCHEGRHDTGDMEAAAGLIGDCAFVVASRIGPGAVSALLSRGIRAVVDADFVEEGLRKLLVSGKIKYLSKR